MQSAMQAPAAAAACSTCPSWRRLAVYRTGKPVTRRSRCAVAGSRRTAAVLSAAFAPPTVSDTKAKFTKLYPAPVPAIYSTVVQELIVQQHFIRYNKYYSYDPIFALGVTSAFDQILEGAGPSSSDIFDAYIKCLDEDPKKYKKDAEKLEADCAELEGLSGLIPGDDGSLNGVQEAVKSVADKVAKKDFYYNKFFAIGMFRILELAGVKEPQALGSLVESMGLKQDAVNRDLKLYKNILSKLSAGKELMKEVMEREKKKAAERAAAKAAKAEPEPEKVESETKKVEAEPEKAEVVTESTEA